MKSKKISGSILLIVGITFYIFGAFISGQVKEGEKKIQGAQSGVNTATGVTRINRYTKQVGRFFASPIQNKINQGKEKAGKFKVLSLCLRIGGILLFVIGIFILLQGFKNRRKK